jgi:predicted nucleic acid-binding protein
VIVLDSSAWIEVFRPSGNPAFRDALREDGEVIVPAICLYEVTKRLLREFDEDVVSEIVEPMTQTGVFEPMDADLATRASGMSLTTGLAMADAIILTSARRRFAPLWTQDPHFEGLEGVHYVERM